MIFDDRRWQFLHWSLISPPTMCARVCVKQQYRHEILWSCGFFDRLMGFCSSFGYFFRLIYLFLLPNAEHTQKKTIHTPVSGGKAKKKKKSEEKNKTKTNNNTDSSTTIKYQRN